MASEGCTSAALIWWRRLFKDCTRQIYFFLYFIQRYTFYLLIFLWTDTILIVNLELRGEFTRWKKPESFIITRAKISAVRASSFVVVEQFTTFRQFRFHCLPVYQNLCCFKIVYSVFPGYSRVIRRATFTNFFVPDAAPIRGRRLIEGGAYSSRYGMWPRS